MQENFLSNDSELPSNDVSFQASSDSVPRKEIVKIMVIGSRKGITSVIKMLHTLMFAEAGEWSPIMPHGESGEMMSVLRKKVLG
ncbi:hypothetical protein H6F98_17120 [Microcoleus sp. FACHB-SPT15]|uniref:hypothetical protein n=1 Tax=Microcoleus sp. FACHB-SPT15 TaxID=2692830 RepID=UPI00177B43FC|nr:hypothetical protein [Microcoleus sp. FACHB-SPT15]MBD1807160.1 hypothetical protein [Microcoleus sp. FACHB-SPT15]